MSHTCTATKQLPFLKLWMAWGLMEVLGGNCPQASPSHHPQEPALVLLQLPLVLPLSQPLSLGPELSFETHPAPLPSLFLLVPSGFCLATLFSVTLELL